MSPRFTLVIAMLATGLLLAGCKVDLYSSLEEKEANQILAVLMERGISASKLELENGFAIRVPESDIADAVTILTAKGLPREQSASMGAAFAKSGLISSPFEDRVRYIYALGAEVATTLREIDGVIAARVHVVLPEPSQFGRDQKPSSAAVFIKHEPGVDIEYMVPQIRRLVDSSIEGLEYANIAVLLSEASPADLRQGTSKGALVKVIPGLSVREQDVLYFWRIVYVLGIGVVALVLTLIALVAYYGVYRGWRRPARGSEVSSARGHG